MINFRYHVVSLTAVLLALAAGVVLGAGFLDRSDDDAATVATTDSAIASFEAGYASRTAPLLTNDVLDSTSVLIVTTTGARAEDVKGVTSAIERAGGSVVGSVELTAKLLDPGGRQFADGVAEKAGAEVAEITDAAPGYPRIGAALARAYLATKAADADETSAQLAAAFTEGELVVGEQPDRRASLAVVVTAPRSSATEQQGASLAALVTALDQASAGVVVAGPTSSSQQGGLVDAVRADDGASQVSTVDVADLALGRIAVALALAEELDGRSGAWGTARSADGALPAAS